jgi:hypothetical protein
MVQAFNREAVRRAYAVLAMGLGALVMGRTAFAQVDPVVFSFATVGDSRTDPNAPDPTTLITNPNPTTQGGVPSLTGQMLPQDNEWVQNTLALSTILSNIQSQGPNLLFFNGDMIFGYGRPIIPTTWQANPQAALTLPNSWGNYLVPSDVVTPPKTPPVPPANPPLLTSDFVFQLQQYAYWRGLIAPMFLAGTYVIPVPGNHETQCSSTAAPYGTAGNLATNPNCDTKTEGNLQGKTAYIENENMFRMSTADLVQDLTTNLRFSNATGFFPTNVTGLTAQDAPAASTNNGNITSSQAELSYSFDITAKPGLILHFAVINTDPAGADSTAPADWLANDFLNAKSRGASKYFVFGHKAAFTYNYNPAGSTPVAPGGLDARTVVSNGKAVIDTTLRDAFWSVIAQYGATYFAGHEHTVNVSRNPDPKGLNPAPFQVIVGSGGSPFDDKMTLTNCAEPNISGCEPGQAHSSDRYYAWALVQVHQSGTITMQVSGFNDQFGGVQDLTVYDVPGKSFAGVTTLQ